MYSIVVEKRIKKYLILQSFVVLKNKYFKNKIKLYLYLLKFEYFILKYIIKLIL